jgi:hypothetical protein
MAPFFRSLSRKFLLSFFTVSLISTLAIAQEDVGDDPDFPDVPLDGGLSLLLVAGAAYGGKKVHDYRKRKDEKTF